MNVNVNVIARARARRPAAARSQSSFFECVLSPPAMRLCCSRQSRETRCITKLKIVRSAQHRVPLNTIAHTPGGSEAHATTRGEAKPSRKANAYRTGGSDTHTQTQRRHTHTFPRSIHPIRSSSLSTETALDRHNASLTQRSLLERQCSLLTHAAQSTDALLSGTRQ